MRKDGEERFRNQEKQDLNSEEEVLILHKEYESRKIVVSFCGYESFNLDNFDNSEARAEFKVDDEDTPLSLDALQVPGIFQEGTGGVLRQKDVCVEAGVPCTEANECSLLQIVANH
ncbi:hypothetical protein P5673_009103 [Acropora cervicornis]|uniref:Uncharacterized protein n=1 Tax=Acropora cervicornis TaxID=6130 RepID=A0AAD9V9Q8_ACRCE|nr:hypothetical protein P5673_009103 [Acropora cervicornis]